MIRNSPFPSPASRAFAHSFCSTSLSALHDPSCCRLYRTVCIVVSQARIMFCTHCRVWSHLLTRCQIRHTAVHNLFQVAPVALRPSASGPSDSGHHDEILLARHHRCRDLHHARQAPACSLSGRRRIRARGSIYSMPRSDQHEYSRPSASVDLAGKEKIPSVCS